MKRREASVIKTHNTPKMKKKITLKYYGHKHPEQLLMRAANMISAVTPTDALRINTSTKSATIYADPIQARAVAKQIKKSTGVTLIVNLPDNVGRFIDFLVAEGVFAPHMWLTKPMSRMLARTPVDRWIEPDVSMPADTYFEYLVLRAKWQNILLTNKVQNK